MIRFPGLGFSLAIEPVAFRIFAIEIRFYAICIVLAIVVALLLCYKARKEFQISFDFVFETLQYALIVGFIGARMYYVFFHWQDYVASPWKIFCVRDGGLAIYGGLIAGGLVILKRCQKWKVDALEFLDDIVPFVAIAQSIGRWGNFFNQEAYGTQTTNILRMGIFTENGYQEVHPAFLYESIVTFCLFFILRKWQKNQKFTGQIFYGYLFFYAGARMVIEAIRIDSLMFFQFRISQILSCAIFVFSSIMLLKKRRKQMVHRFYRSKMEKKVYKKLF